MKTIVLASALAVLATGSAFAATTHTTHHLRHERRLSDSNASVTRDPMGVYVNGREIGRDPDPAIRDELYNEYYELQGH
jgi:hypothetical protein